MALRMIEALDAAIERLVRSQPAAVWAVDIIGAPSALMLALLAQAGQTVQYASGRVVAAMSSAYVGEGKTDAKDAFVIAETARIRRDLAVIDGDADLLNPSSPNNASANPVPSLIVRGLVVVAAFEQRQRWRGP